VSGHEDGSAPVKFGKYEVLATLGAGAMGVVYLAYDPFIQRRVALKTIRKDLLAGRHAQHLGARFRQEAMAAGRLTHPGIVAVYD
jgi:serine/threonine protein kinase